MATVAPALVLLCGGVPFVAGYNPDIQFMAHLREPLNPAYRPLLFYLITDGVAWCSRLLLRRWGFQHHRHA